MTKYVVSGYVGFDNFGDEAIASVLSSYLKKSGAEKVTYISKNPAKTAELYGVNAVKMLNFVKTIIESDVLISGGGSLLQDITSLKSLLYYLSVIMTALVFGKKVFIFAQGFSKFKTPLGKYLTKFVLKQCDKVSVRDIKSQEYLSSLGIPSELVSDPAFNIEISPSSHKGVGVQLRNFKTLTNEFLVLLAEKISEIFKGQEIKLFSMQDNIDMPVLEKFAEMLSSNGCDVKIIKNNNITECVSEISALEYFIAMRYHACLISAKAGVKTLGINYDSKVKNLSTTIGFPIINLRGDEVGKGIEVLLNQESDKYNIPKFKFPEIIL